MQTAAIVTDIPCVMFRLSMGSCGPACLSLINSSSAELYFLSSIIISPVFFPAHVLEPLNFDPTHLSWPPTLEPLINSWILSGPNRHICLDCLCPALDL